ncbi:MAG TPA: hypothetical protein VED63_03755 [Acidimicrobiales bacterium]|nr:hypothetical protein [Acidimicrobiales bacterium]
MGAIGVTLVVLGAGLFGTALAATAVAASAAPTIAFTQDAPIGAPPATDVVFVTGSGFKDSSQGALFECNTATPQPTIDVGVASGKTTVDLGQIPVGCSPPTPVKTTAAGKFPATAAFSLASGVLGPPATGTDSAGTDATADADDFPCPPYTNQASASCVLMFVDAAKDTASQAITFSPSQTPTTAPVTTVPTTCVGVPATNSVANNTVTPPTNPSVTVDPATCLQAGQVVTVTATGLQANEIGSVLECSSAGSEATYSGADGATLSSIAAGTLAASGVVDPPPPSGTLSIVASGGEAAFSYSAVTVSGSDATFTGLTLTGGTGTWTVAAGAFITYGQPTVAYLGNAIPVSCSKVKILTTTATGGIATADQAFTIQTGVIGPPASGTDSAGNDAATDAAKYPCPPTAAQVAAGNSCVIAVGDVAGDKVFVKIGFNGTGGPPVTTTTTANTTATTTGGSGSGGSGSGGSESGGSGSSPSTSASTGELAFTGSGPGMWLVGLLGVVLVFLGGSLLVAADAPRRLVYAARHRGERPTGGR